MDPRLEQLATNLYTLNPGLRPTIDRLTIKANNTVLAALGAPVNINARMQFNDPDAMLLINHMANFGVNAGHLNAAGQQMFRTMAETAYNSFAVNPGATHMWNIDKVGEGVGLPNEKFRISDVIGMYMLAAQQQLQAGGNAPPGGGNRPPAGGNAPPAGGNAPPGGGNRPPGGGNAPPAGGNAPPGGGNAPPAGGNMPPVGNVPDPNMGDFPPQDPNVGIA